MRLHLDPSAKFPSELESYREKNKTAIDLIVAWRYEQSHNSKGGRVCPMCHRDFEEMYSKDEEGE